MMNNKLRIIFTNCQIISISINYNQILETLFDDLFKCMIIINLSNFYLQTIGRKTIFPSFMTNTSVDAFWS